MCLLEHRARQVDAGHRTITRIQRGVDAGADPDFEDTVAPLDAHPLNGVHAARVKRGSEREVIDPGNVLVHARHEIVLDDCYRQRARCGVGSEDFLAFTRTVRLE